MFVVSYVYTIIILPDKDSERNGKDSDFREISVSCLGIHIYMNMIDGFVVAQRRQTAREIQLRVHALVHRSPDAWIYGSIL